MIDPSIRLRRAILLNDVLLVQRIIRSNPSRPLRNPDFDDKSNTSLHLAATNGFTEIAAFLIQAGHEDDEISRNADHETPLMLATRAGHIEVSRLLVQKFPRCVVIVNKSGQDALAISSQCPASAALIPVLLEENEGYAADVHGKDADGNTALHHASASGSLKALRILLAAGANPLAKNHYDWTPLAYSQTVAAEVYFKNLVAEFERKKVEGARQGEERERQRVAGLRLVNDDAGGSGGGGGGGKGRAGEPDEDEAIGDALRRQWSPVERRRPVTPGSNPRHEWISPQQAARQRAGSSD